MVADGYKDTEIGVIPIEWEVVHLDDITMKITSGGTPSRSKDEYFINGTINWLKTGELRDCYIYEAKEKITKEAINNSSAKLFPIDTLLIAMYGATIGQTAYLKTECATNQACCAIMFDKKLANPFFYWKYFYFIKDTLIGLGRGAGQPNISQGIIKDLKIPLPPLKEQEKIADILSTADDKIDAIATQIEKAETLKKGLLQKLLSEGIGHSVFKDSELGKIPESWEVVRLGDIGSFKNGINKNKEDFGFGNKFFNLLDVFGLTSIKNEPLGLVNISNKEKEDFDTKKGDTFFIRSSVKPSGVGLTAVLLYAPIDTVYSGFIIRFRDYNKFELNFKKYCFYDSEFRKMLLSKSSVSANTNINQEALKSLLIKLPPLEEQKQIAEILSTADEKLEVLRAKKQMYETLKKGLLQKLLSGEVRV